MDKPIKVKVGGWLHNIIDPNSPQEIGEWEYCGTMFEVLELSGARVPIEAIEFLRSEDARDMMADDLRDKEPENYYRHTVWLWCEDGEWTFV